MNRSVLQRRGNISDRGAEHLEGVHVGRTLGRAVVHEMQCRNSVDMQALEQAIAQEACGLVQTFSGFFRVTRENAEEHLGMCVVG